MAKSAWMAARDAQVALYRKSHGKLGASIGSHPLLLLSVTGRKTGAVHTVPLAYVRDGEDVVIAASKGGADTDPLWLANLEANPAVRVQVGADEDAAHATIRGVGADRDRRYAMCVAQGGGFADYEKKTARVIPVVRLARDSDGRP